MILKFQVQYDVLDVYLEENEEDKSIVYSSLDENIPIINNTVNSAYNKHTNQHSNISQDVKPDFVIDDFKINCECDLSVNECECVARNYKEKKEDDNVSHSRSSNKKRHRRGKNKGKNEDSNIGSEDNKYWRHDQLFLLPSAHSILLGSSNNQQENNEAGGWGDLPPEPPGHLPWGQMPSVSTGGETEKENLACVVSLEDLSECEASDNESIGSDSLDLEQLREDRSFQMSNYSASGRKNKNKRSGLQTNNLTNNARCRDSQPVQSHNNNINGQSDALHANIKDINKGCDALSGNLCLTDSAASSATVNNLSVSDNSIDTNSVSDYNQIDMNLLMEDINNKSACISITNEHQDNNSNKNKKKRNKVCDQIVNSLSSLPKNNNSSNSSNFIQKKENEDVVKIDNCAKARSSDKNKQYQQNSNKAYNSQKFVEPTRTEPNLKQVMKLQNWKKFIQRTAKVVNISEKKHTRLGAGALKLFADSNPNFALFSPNDNRVPRMKIPMSQCPLDFFTRSKDYAAKIFLARIVLWNDPKFALG